MGKYCKFKKAATLHTSATALYICLRTQRSAELSLIFHTLLLGVVDDIATVRLNTVVLLS